MVLNFQLDVLVKSSLMMLICSSVYASVIILILYIRVFGPSQFNMSLLKSSLKCTLMRDLRLKTLILYLVTSINSFLILHMESLGKNGVIIRLNSRQKRKWKMKIYILMTSLTVFNLEMGRSVIKYIRSRRKEKPCRLITLLAIFLRIPSKS